MDNNMKNKKKKIKEEVIKPAPARPIFGLFLWPEDCVLRGSYSPAIENENANDSWYEYERKLKKPMC